MTLQCKVDVLIAQFCYGGNGGVASILPELATWLASLTSTLSKDDRVGRVGVRRYGDVPLTMERNRVVRDAITEGYDIILMLDSDNLPDLYLGKRPWAKPFWDSSFDFAFQRLLRGLPSVVCAPYCGPPPHPVNGGEENVYVFYTQSRETRAKNPGFRFEAYSREHASQMRGIQEIAAGPTGVILYTTSAFELMTFDRRPIVEILADFKSGLITAEQCQRQIQMQSYFYYEFTDQWQTRKASTEDVTNTREIGMAGQLKFGEPVVFCNWDAWAGHMKPQLVGMPEPIRMEQVSAFYQEAVLNGLKAGESLCEVDFSEKLKPSPAEFDRIAKQAIQVGRELLSAPPVSEPEESEPAEIPEETTKPIDQADLEKITKVPIKSRLICGRKMNSVGHVTPDHHLEALTKLVQSISKLHGNRRLRMLEVGSWVGESAVALLGGAPRGSVIYCVDTWEGSKSDWTGHIAAAEDPMDWFVKNMSELIGETVFPMRGDSVSVAESMSDPQELDLIFLDADHEYEAIKADLQAWYRHLGPRGVLCGHDYCPEFPGVIRAVDDFCDLAGLKPTVIAKTTVWFVTKTQIERGLAAKAQQAVEVPAQGRLFDGVDTDVRNVLNSNAV